MSEGQWGRALPAQGKLPIGTSRPSFQEHRERWKLFAAPCLVRCAIAFRGGLTGQWITRR